jgi:hypothetical protein
LYRSINVEDAKEFIDPLSEAIALARSPATIKPLTPLGSCSTMNFGNIRSPFWNGKAP